MNQTKQENSSDASLLLPIKRKRGRPRKDRSLNRAEAAPVPPGLPPGFEVVNGTLPSQVDPVNKANDSIIGQTVTGVVEAAFDAGYLLAVKIGNSNTSLRGVVFKPGHYAPVTAENDVAPHVQMIRRNEAHLSTENKTRVRGRKPRPRSRERDMQLVSYLGNGAPPSSQGKYLPAPSVPPVGARGTVVPVILQPVNLGNGVPANEVTALKGKHVQTVLPLSVYPPNGSTSQALPSQPQISSQGTTEVRHVGEAKPKKISNVHFQGEAVKGGQGSSQSSEAQNGDGGQGEEIADMNEPLFIEPLQTRHSILSQSAPFFKPVENNGTGRMSELLQAMQDNLSQNQIPHAEHRTQGFTVEFREPKSVETQSRAEETRAQTYTQAESK